MVCVRSDTNHSVPQEGRPSGAVCCFRGAASPPAPALSAPARAPVVDQAGFGLLGRPLRIRDQPLHVREAVQVPAGQRLAEHQLDLAQLTRLLGRQEADGSTRGAGPRGAADAMNVVLCLTRQIVVDDVGDTVHVYAPSDDVGGHEHPVGAVLEAVEGVLPLRLAAVRMDSGALDAAALQMAADPVGAVLGAREDEDPIEVLLFEKADEKVGLLGFSNRVDRLADPFDRGSRGSDFHADWDCPGWVRRSASRRWSGWRRRACSAVSRARS